MRTTLTDNGAVTTAVSVSEAKAHLRVYHSEDDSYLGSLVLSATQVIEHETKHALITRQFVLGMDQFPEDEIVLPRSPLGAVSSITYTDTAGALQTLSSSVYLVYQVNAVPRIKRKASQTWPNISTEGGLPISVTFTAGYGAISANIPQSLRHAVLLQAAHMYENRTAVAPAQMYEIPRTVERLIVQYHSGDYS